MSSKNFGLRDSVLPTLSLFTSISTLVCCALPALFVSLGAGATLAGLVSSAPWLVSLSKYKAWTFGIAGVLLLGAAIMTHRAKRLPCPVDPVKAKACMRLRKFNVWVVGFSVLVYAVGFFFAFLAKYILL